MVFIRHHDDNESIKPYGWLMLAIISLFLSDISKYSNPFSQQTRDVSPMLASVTDGEPTLTQQWANV